MNTGTSGSVASMTSADVRSIAATQPSTASGTTHASTTWGR